MELEQREGTMAAVGFEEFSAPPGSELALPPLFGGHILESELETEVEFVSGGLGDSGLRERDEEEEAARGRRRRQRELNRRKYQALGRRCREIEQVNERVLNRLHQVQRITRRLQQERRRCPSACISVHTDSSCECWTHTGMTTGIASSPLCWRMMAAKALMSLPQAMLRMNLQRKRDFPHHKGQLQP
ncbi:TCF3 fusion partner homolog isoform X2 [Rattus norvegicus]|uniref:TCF3 fusion partner homolog isoform X2 n=1 Tax=Rattus norvegicus TaxID=10116 RepID=UPI002FD84D1B